MTAGVDLVSVAHTDRYHELASELESAIAKHHPSDADWTFTVVDNRRVNRGFARGCNLGAKDGANPIVGFVNPRIVVSGPFLGRVRGVFGDPLVVITGSTFGKQPAEYRKVWGCKAWCSGSLLFVARDWWQKLSGFDEHYNWGFEDTDLIRRTEEACGVVLPLEDLPIDASPVDDAPEIAEYKRRNFDAGAQRFYKRWGAKTAVEP